MSAIDNARFCYYSKQILLSSDTTGRIKNKMENIINVDLDLSSSGNETDSDSDNDTDNEPDNDGSNE